MNAYFTLKDNTKLNIYVWSDFLENKNWRGFVDVCLVDANGHSGEEFETPVYNDEQGVYIIYNGEKVYLNNYDYLPYEQLMEKIAECVEKKDPWICRNDDILATFMKESEKVGIVGNMMMYDFIIPEFGIGITSDKKMEVLVIPTEKHYKKSEWHYKFTMEPEDESLQGIVASQDIYFSDFCSALKKGIFRLVDKKEYKQRNENKLKNRQE